MNPKRSAALDMAEFIKIDKYRNITFEIYSTELNIKEIMDSANKFYLKSLENILEMDVIKNNQNIYKKMEEIKRQIKNSKENEMFIQLGFGGNYFTKSFGSILVDIFRDRNLFEFRKTLGFGVRKKNQVKNPFPKTFTVVNDVQPGWIKMTRL